MAHKIGPSHLVDFTWRLLRLHHSNEFLFKLELGLE